MENGHTHAVMDLAKDPYRQEEAIRLHNYLFSGMFPSLHL